MTDKQKQAVELLNSIRSKKDAEGTEIMTAEEYLTLLEFIIGEQPTAADNVCALHAGLDTALAVSAAAAVLSADTVLADNDTGRLATIAVSSDM